MVLVKTNKITRTKPWAQKTWKCSHFSRTYHSWSHCHLGSRDLPRRPLFFMLTQILTMCSCLSLSVLSGLCSLGSLGGEMHVTFQSQHTALGAIDDMLHQLIFHSAWQLSKIPKNRGKTLHYYFQVLHIYKNHQVRAVSTWSQKYRTEVASWQKSLSNLREILKYILADFQSHQKCLEPLMPSRMLGASYSQHLVSDKRKTKPYIWMQSK